jgi:hypothetical protein
MLTKIYTGPSGLHVCGATNDENSMRYGVQAGTYASFFADLRDLSHHIGHNTRIFKIAFFFSISCDVPREPDVSTKPERIFVEGERKSSRLAAMSNGVHLG